MDKLLNIIKKAEVREDCNGKFDLDFPLLECLSRGYPPHYNRDGRWSMYVCYCCHDDDILKDDILKDEIFADTKEELIIMAKRWYAEHLSEALNILNGYVERG